MKRRSADCSKLRRPLKRNRITEGIYGRYRAAAGVKEGGVGGGEEEEEEDGDRDALPRSPRTPGPPQRLPRPRPCQRGPRAPWRPVSPLRRCPAPRPGRAAARPHRPLRLPFPSLIPLTRSRLRRDVGNRGWGKGERGVWGGAAGQGPVGAAWRKKR